MVQKLDGLMGTVGVSARHDNGWRKGGGRLGLSRCIGECGRGRPHSLKAGDEVPR